MKLFERLVARQLMDYADLLPSLQSGFRPGHSTETAILRVLSDILQAVDRGDSAALVLLDLSAAFKTVDNKILIQRLQSTYNIHSSVLQWFRSYLLGRTQHVRRGSARSSAVHLVCGVPRGSVISPILFILYTADLVALIESLGRHTSTPMTPRFTAPVHHHTSTRFYQNLKSSTASPLSLTGCSPTICNSTTTRRSSYGAQRTVANIFCPLLVLPSAF